MATRVPALYVGPVGERHRYFLALGIAQRQGVGGALDDDALDLHLLAKGDRARPGRFLSFILLGPPLGRPLSAQRQRERERQNCKDQEAPASKSFHTSVPPGCDYIRLLVFSGAQRIRP